MKTQHQQTRELAIKFRQEYPELVREMSVDFPAHPDVTYNEIPLLKNGNVGPKRSLGGGGIYQVTAGNLYTKVYKGRVDSSILLPNMATDDTFTSEEKAVGESFAWFGEA